VDADAIADGPLVALAKRGYDAFADADLVDESFRHRVGIGVIKRPIEDDVGVDGAVGGFVE
jgi:hypothetical protein